MCHLLEEPVVPTGRNPVDRVVGAHEPRDLALLDAGLKRLEIRVNLRERGREGERQSMLKAQVSATAAATADY